MSDEANEKVLRSEQVDKGIIMFCYAIKCPDCGHKEELSQSEIPGFGQFVERTCEVCHWVLQVKQLSQSMLLITRTERRQV